MALTIDATVGGASANSFVLLTEFATYMESRSNSDAYDDADSDDTRNRALAEATRELSALMWQGYRVDDTQALAWPRDLVANPDDPNGAFYDNDAIPGRIKRATYELALAVLKAGTTDIFSLDESLNVQSEEIGGAISTSYYEPSARIRGLARYPAVMREIRPLLAGRTLGSPVVRG